MLYKCFTKESIDKNDSIINYQENTRYDGIVVENNSDILYNFVITNLLYNSRIKFEGYLNNLFVTDSHYASKINQLSIETNKVNSITVHNMNIESIFLEGRLQKMEQLIFINSSFLNVIVPQKFEIKKMCLVDTNKKVIKYCKPSINKIIKMKDYE